ncbi:MAG TPA: efflux RND transporter periplasmic adaptor subunit [Thermoanaerobaculia bacterium]|nr:efflux RND transporter periplasmic adaptor subunit [Thermoanaerobaculia bacterium]
MNKKRSLIAIAAVALIALIGVFVYRVAYAKETPAYRFATVERGNVRSTVSATGTLNAVTTVSVGTQVSGQVSQIYADFNDHVKNGQLLARIDPTLAQQAVTDAQANLEKAQAQALQAARDNARNRELTNDGLVAKSAFEQTQSAAEVADAEVKSARVALDKARQNLAYTNIYAPIDGVVVERNVQQGQTVAASLSAPQLFLIANDLSQMQILAQVGESDIAQIKEGQAVDFTVQALQGQTFHGSVKQVRLQSATTDNVVNYTVVVSVANPDGKLLPGMTARTNFLTKAADNVLEVPNAALRFKPSDAQLAELKASRTESATSTGTSTSTSTAWQQKRSRNGNGAASNFGTLYFLDANGKLATTHARTGVTDGSVTEISGRNLTAGMKVITGTVSATQSAQSASSSSPSTPFQSGQQQQRGPRGGF